MGFEPVPPLTSLYTGAHNANTQPERQRGADPSGPTSTTMSFDEQLRRAFDTLTDRLREDIVRQLRAVSDEVAAAARDETERAASSARAEAAVAVQADVERMIEDRVAGVVRDLEARVAEAESAALAKVQDAERAGDARVANTAAAADARTAAAVAAAETRLREEADRQMREAIDAAVAAALAESDTPARTSAAVDPAASERQVAAFREIDAAQTLTGILDALTEAAGREARSALLLAGGGQLRAWRFSGFGSDLSNARDLRFAFADAPIVTSAVRDRVTSAGDMSNAPRFAALPQGRACAAIPILMAGQAVAVLYADEGDALSAPPASSWRGAVEAIARYGARALEALTAFKAAGLMAKQAAGRAPLGLQARAAAAAGATREDAATTTDEDESARRYARLLVSELKLYHEAEVATGQRERNLATRLGAEIDRARVLYEQRVPAELRLRTDYFHAELVRTLANGDVSLLSTL